ncbi:VPLPA-CTERM sorting domain-containing protein [Paracoccus aerius]|uniref:VPLPA-CTERM sorting domain-containing protein n=1 Tax=Paracoccus aerius TaxID=1915382 RepID=UPI00174D73AD|nr:VPLPA-CTERM sorting domain-containing protein [Paracoccus aerius]
MAYDYHSITWDTSEDFEKYSSGRLGSNTFNGFSIDFSGGSSNSPGVCFESVYCPTKALVEWDEGEGARNLLGFSGATKYVGFLLDTFWDNGYPEPRTDLPDTFQIVVEGVSGVFKTSLTPTAPEYLGFFDSAGLISISILNFGSEYESGSAMWNYAIDDVITGTDVAPVPLPAAGGFLLAALSSLGWLTKRRKQSAA